MLLDRKGPECHKTHSRVCLQDGGDCFGGESGKRQCSSSGLTRRQCAAPEFWNRLVSAGVIVRANFIHNRFILFFSFDCNFSYETLMAVVVSSCSCCVSGCCSWKKKKKKYWIKYWLQLCKSQTMQFWLQHSSFEGFKPVEFSQLV